MKTIRVGDMHVTPNNLKESDSLMKFVLSNALDLKTDRIEFLGDLFHTHAMVRLEVLDFWDKWLNELSDYSGKFDMIVLTGNHDIGGDYTNNYSALQVFNDIEFVNIVSAPVAVGVVGYMPYIHDNAKFVEEANRLAEHGVKVLVSHTTYQGSKYDNGMYAPDGVDPDLLDPRLTHLISGHVHAEQSFGRVWYPGTARWLSKSCANRRKGIWIVEHDDATGAILSKEFISTENVCQKIVSVKWNEGEDKPEIPENAKVDIELIGSSEWVLAQKKELKGTVSVSSKITDVKKSASRKAGKSLFEFLSSHYQVSPEKREKLLTYMRRLELLG